MIEIRHSNVNNKIDLQSEYNLIYKNTEFTLRDSFYLWILNLLKPEPGKLFLDISCGQGTLIKFAQKMGLISIGLDFSIEAIKKAAIISPQSRWIISDGEAIPLSDSCIDYVTNIGSIEHYQHPEEGIKEISRVLKSNGTACILLPNSFGLFGNIKNVLKTGQVFDDIQPLQRYNTPTGWFNMLTTNGLHPIKVYKYEREWPQTMKDLWWYLLNPQKIARLLITWIIPTNLANCLVYICKKIS
jgi:ubiquinone/menaquinone biosynthesis C-methylase UbiE